MGGKCRAIARLTKCARGRGLASLSPTQLLWSPVPFSVQDTVEFPPFRSGVNAGAGGVMTAHISFPKLLGNATPATLSPYFLRRVLREEMGFKGYASVPVAECHKKAAFWECAGQCSRLILCRTCR